MREILLEGATLVGESVAMVVLVTLGALAERAAVTTLQSGLDPLAVWYFGMGAVALYAGIYMLGYQTLLPHLSASVSGDRA